MHSCTRSTLILSRDRAFTQKMRTREWEIALLVVGSVVLRLGREWEIALLVVGSVSAMVREWELALLVVRTHLDLVEPQEAAQQGVLLVHHVTEVVLQDAAVEEEIFLALLHRLQHKVFVLAEEEQHPALACRRAWRRARASAWGPPFTLSLSLGPVGEAGNSTRTRARRAKTRAER